MSTQKTIDHDHVEAVDGLHATEYRGDRPVVDCALPRGIREWLRHRLGSISLNFHLDFWGHDSLHITDERNLLPSIQLYIHHPGVLRTLLLSQDPLALMDAYLQGFIDVEGDLATVIPLVQQHPHVKMSVMRSLHAWLDAWRLPRLPELEQKTFTWKRLSFHTRDRDRATIQFHYDTGNEFYRTWLDPHMVYSCAYFEHPQMSLKEAQEAKLDRICRKLQLSPGEYFLDIGCGWGSLLSWAVTHYGVNAHGITLSEEQLAFNQKWINDAELGDRVTVELLDYRDLPKTPTFDKIASIGMVEHVGADNYPAYFQSVLSALKPGGLFLNHGIASRDRWRGTSFGERFIDRYIFPDGQLTYLSTRLIAAEDAGWEIVDVDAWRPHYAKTLWCWVKNFEASMDQIVAKIGERRVQLWRLYLIGSALGFENNYIGIYQTLFRRKADAVWDLPINRIGWLD
jgi:cyclopropane-fatty-acyl-phospholipid synthase